MMTRVGHFLLMIAVAGCTSQPKIIPNNPYAEAAIDKAIRIVLKRPNGSLTKADLENVRWLYLDKSQITDITPLARLKQLESIALYDNPHLSTAEIAKLQRLLPKCKIYHNAKLSPKESAAFIEAAIRREIDKPTGKLSKADLEKVTWLHLENSQIGDISALAELNQLKTLYLAQNKLSDVSPLVKLEKLEYLVLYDNPSLPQAEIDVLLKALPNCVIMHNAKK